MEVVQSRIEAEGFDLGTVAAPQKRFNVEEYHRMVEAGILNEDERVELIKGVIVLMSPKGSRHSSCVKRLNVHLSRLLSDRYIVSVQDPIRLRDESEPEPDLAVLKFRTDYYAHSHPTADDVHLIIEVAETTVETDRTVKLSMYAEAGISEYVIVNLPERTVERRTNPMNGRYDTVAVFRREEIFQSTRISDLRLKVDEILG